MTEVSSCTNSVILPAEFSVTYHIYLNARLGFFLKFGP